MKKLMFLALLSLTISSVKAFATDDKDKPKKTDEKCLMNGSCCKKGATKAAMLKAAAKPAAKASARKA